MSETCIVCHKEITENPIPYMPIKIPGAYQETTLVVTPHTKMILGTELVEVKVEDKTGEIVIVEEERPCMVEYTYDKVREVKGEWKTDGEHPLLYWHGNCSASKYQEAK